MIKAIWNGLAIALLLNFLALIGGALWLHQTGRLNRERIRSVKHLFERTIKEEQKLEQQAQAMAEQANKDAEELARLRGAGNGDVTIDARLSADEQANEIAMLTVNRLREEIRGLNGRMQSMQTRLAEQQQLVQTQREAFEKTLDEERTRRESEGFKDAVNMYEKIQAKQAKQMLIELIGVGSAGEKQAVDYLAAMNERKAAEILGQFKDEREIPLATRLVERLRTRGIDPLPGRFVQAGNAP